MRYFNLPRRRIQREFYRWLKEFKTEFAIPVVVSRRRNRYLECRMVGIANDIKITLSTYDITVSAEMNGECWDLLTWFDTAPRKRNGTYVCVQCDPKTRSSYSSREEIWRKEIFEPFRNWVNDTLAHCDWLALYKGKTDGSAWAKIGPGIDNNPPELKYLCSVNKLRVENPGALLFVSCHEVSPKNE